MDKRYKDYAMNLVAILFFAGLLAWGDFTLFILTYFGIFIFTVIRTLQTPSKKRTKFYLIIAFFIAYFFQTVFAAFIMNGALMTSIWQIALRKSFCLLLMFLPMLVVRYITVGKFSRFYLPSVNEALTLSFQEVNNYSSKITSAINTLSAAGKKLSLENFKVFLADLPRNNSFEYINNGSLTKEYFDRAKDSLEDPHMYIVISNTGSAASELVSAFTQKDYSHVSISFDQELNTTISYNGGERVYPPGLNHEMLQFFNKKDDANILVYRLSCTMQQKKKILDKIEEINREGSAYNMVGLVLKYSHKPNIMFCSQFVYKMLELAELTYFEKNGDGVRPTDFIELDYYRKLEFDYKIQLNKQS